MMEQNNSERIWGRLIQRMPGGVSSPIRAGKSIGIYPPVIAKGDGCWIEDIDGNRYIDCCMSWGALLHGHAHPAVVAAAREALERGSTFGASTVAEGELAEVICKAMPSIEMVRFVSTGTESTMSAVRLCRAATGRSKVIKFKGHYHGHADQFLVSAGSGVAFLPQAQSIGIPSEFVQHTVCVPFNDDEALDRVFDSIGSQIAAVIIEPIAANMGVVPSTMQFLEHVRTRTSEAGALLIFDEVVTGFRVGRGGAQEWYEMSPDITCLGKIIGGGFPAAAFGGKKELMKLLAPVGHVYQAGTLSGNPVAMSAGIAALRLGEEEGFYQNLEQKAAHLFQPVEQYIADHQIKACVQRHGSMATLFLGATAVAGRGEEILDSEQYKRFFSFMLRKRIYLPLAQNEAWFLSSSHNNDEIEHISSSIIDFFISDCSYSVKQVFNQNT
jgi:glutamate-1-semialdehyde 2,1-aminomutase